MSTTTELIALADPRFPTELADFDPQEPDTNRANTGTVTPIANCGERYEQILSPAALEFLAAMHDRFAGTRFKLLRARSARRAELATGTRMNFLAETRQIRDDDSWSVAGAGPGLHDRRVEITGPTDRKMTVNALNSGANVWLADHEDALAPTWENLVHGQLNLFDAIRRNIDFTSPEGKEYRLGDTTPTIVFRPRGWHLPESHVRYETASGQRIAVSGGMFDAGLYLFHNAHELISRGSGPYLYLPKIENYLEARLWNEIFTFTEQYLGLAHGTIRATVLIETVTAAFEMEEILYELRDHCAGLNAGRWDYLFSLIKNIGGRSRKNLLPDRGQITMTVPFMRAYTELLVSTCHKRGAYAIGGMSAFIPNRHDPEVTERAFAQVAADKQREANDGFDGSWVAHPDLVPIARKEFEPFTGARGNQLNRLRDDVDVTAEDLLTLDVPDGTITCAGVKQNISVSLRYLSAWLHGNGAAAIDNLMEDAATAEISRSQLWQWINQGAVTEDGIPVVKERVEYAIDREARQLADAGHPHIDACALLLKDAVLGDEFPSFLTLPAYHDYLAR